MEDKIRRPLETEWEDCAALIYESGPRLFNYMTKLSRYEIYDFFHICFNFPGNYYSLRNIVVLESEGKIRGLLVSYPHKESNGMAKQMKLCGKQFVKEIGLFKMLRMLPGMRLNRFMPDIKDDEYFIASLAVYQMHRSKGIGTKLLDEAVRLARERKFKKISLCVDVDNYAACDLYKKFGFKEVKTTILPKKYKKHNLIGFIKMVKNV